MSEGVLKACPVVGEAWLLGQDPFVDIIEFQPSVWAVLYGSHDELLVADLGLALTWQDWAGHQVLSVGLVLSLLVLNVDLQHV